MEQILKQSRVGQPEKATPVELTDRKGTLSTKHYRHGMLWKESEQVLDNRILYGTSHSAWIAAAEGHDDRFVETRTRYVHGEIKPIVESIYVHLFHMNGKILLYMYSPDFTNRLWVHEGDRSYLLGQVEMIEGVGLNIGAPIDDYISRYPIEVPSTTVKEFQKDHYSKEWKELPRPPL